MPPSRVRPLRPPPRRGRAAAPPAPPRSLARRLSASPPCSSPPRLLDPWIRASKWYEIGPVMGRLDGKVAVITGAGGGIGREAALLFSAEGASVCVADVSADAGEETAAACREAFFQQVDVVEPASVEAMYAATAERYGRVDVLYNNAGIMPAEDASILETEPDAWDRVLDVNAKGVYLCCKYGIPHLLERGGGSVINVASFVALVGAATSQIA